MTPSNPDSPHDIGQQIADLAKNWHQQISGAGDLAALEAIRIEALGRKGPLSEAMRGIGKLPHTERQVIGQTLNIVKKELGQALDARESALAEQALEERLARETEDVTLPPALSAKGALHPITRTCEDILAIFAEMGFSTIEGPDIEDDYHNFTALNMPPDHPARQMHDTFYLCDEDGQSGLENGFAHAYQSGADSGDGGQQATDPGGGAGADLSVRFGYYAYPDVSSS